MKTTGRISTTKIWRRRPDHLVDGVPRRVRPSIFVCRLRDSCSPVVSECLPSGAILIHGGGNFGTLWRKHQDFRIDLMERFPDRPIIQLPQSIHFSDDKSVAETARAIHKHGRFTLLVRDRKSDDFAAAKLDCPVHLCPDMAFYIGRTERVPPKVDVLYLLRTDHEQAGTLRPPDTEETRIVSDWLTESRHRLRLTNLGSFARSVLAGRRAAARAGETYNALASDEKHG
ncbi:MAG: polysaccharide pyruvyl transferase family protein [Gammaproteobacteria bacterium]